MNIAKCTPLPARISLRIIIHFLPVGMGPELLINAMQK
jgi:hypothetical protein